MDAEALKIILDLHRKIYDRALTDILLSIHYDFPDNGSFNYGLGNLTDATIMTIMHDLRQLKTRARLFDELQKQSNNGDNQ